MFEQGNTFYSGAKPVQVCAVNGKQHSSSMAAVPQDSTDTRKLTVRVGNTQGGWRKEYVGEWTKGTSGESGSGSSNLHLDPILETISYLPPLPGYPLTFLGLFLAIHFSGIVSRRWWMTGKHVHKITSAGYPITSPTTAASVGLAACYNMVVNRIGKSAFCVEVFVVYYCNVFK